MSAPKSVVIPFKYQAAKYVHIHFPRVQLSQINMDCMNLVETMRQVKICEHLSKKNPIVFAIQLGFYNAFEYFIMLYPNTLQETPIINNHVNSTAILATRGNSLQIVKYLFENKGYDFSRLLHLKNAVQNKNLHMLSYLFTKYPGTLKHPALTRIAISHGNLLTLKYLLEEKHFQLPDSFSAINNIDTLNYLFSKYDNVFINSKIDSHHCIRNTHKHIKIQLIPKTNNKIRKRIIINAINTNDLELLIETMKHINPKDITSIPDQIVRKAMYFAVKDGHTSVINFIANDNMPFKFREILKREINKTQKVVNSYNAFYN